MSIYHVTQKVPDESHEEDSSVELVKRIRKLRWIGMEDEAEKVQRELKRSPADLRSSVLADPNSTD